MQLALAQPHDAAALSTHLKRQINESGQGGQPIFSPFAFDEFTHFDSQLIQERWQRPIEEIGWMRTWILKDDAIIVGHCDVQNEQPRSMSHRANLSMGLEQAYQGQGWGRLLLINALRWLRTETELAWLDLRVLSSNAKAIKLYQSIGFQEVGRWKDFARFESLQIDDILMTLAIEIFPQEVEN
jgi:RimJ/RimL family protein N-acetyltransferase